MYNIKQVPEDFIVKEINNLQFKESGKYCYYTLIKKSYTTQRAIEKSAKLLKTDSKLIGFSGTKDKNALTYQTISVKGASPCRNLESDDLKLIYIGRGEEQISLGDHISNAFIITLRNIKDIKIKESKYFPNYFDEQRFSKNNVKIGLAILKKDYKLATSLILESNDEYDIKSYLKSHLNDYVGSIKRIPFKIQKFFIGSVQSYIFNETLNELFSTHNPRMIKYSQGYFLFLEDYNIESQNIPLVGFGTEFDDERIKNIVEKKLTDLKLTKRDFIIRSHPDLSSEGDQRKIIAKIENLLVGKLEKDELNKGKKKLQFMFNLPKGSYATIAIKQLILD